MTTLVGWVKPTVLTPRRSTGDRRLPALVLLERVTVALSALETVSPRTPPDPPFLRGGELERARRLLFPPLRRGGTGGFSRGDARQPLGALASITTFVALLVISPWLVRNYRIHGEFVAIKSTFGYAFWQGNCALSEGTDKVRRPSVEPILRRGAAATSLSGLNRALWDARHEAGYLDDIALTKADKRWLGTFSEPERSRILFRRALADLSVDPWRYPRLCLRRLRYFVLFDETNPKSRVRLYRVSHLGLTVFAFAGLLLAGPELRGRLMPTVATAAAIAVFHTLTIVSARFHIPIEPLMTIWGAAGLARWEGRRAGGIRSAPAPHHVERVRVESRLLAVERGGQA
jgi:hypothetical protein